MVKITETEINDMIDERLKQFCCLANKMLKGTGFTVEHCDLSANIDNKYFSARLQFSRRTVIDQDNGDIYADVSCWFVVRPESTDQFLSDYKKTLPAQQALLEFLDTVDVEEQRFKALVMTGAEAAEKRAASEENAKHKKLMSDYIYKSFPKGSRKGKKVVNPYPEFMDEDTYHFRLESGWKYFLVTKEVIELIGS